MIYPGDSGTWGYNQRISALVRIILFDFLKKRQYNYKKRVASKRKSSLPATRFHFAKINIAMKKCVACQRKSSLYDRVRAFFVQKKGVKTKWGKASNYTLCLNSSQLGYDRCEELVMACSE